jgi:hypothetical protein
MECASAIVLRIERFHTPPSDRHGCEYLNTCALHIHTHPQAPFFDALRYTTRAQRAGRPNRHTHMGSLQLFFGNQFLFRALRTNTFSIYMQHHTFARFCRRVCMVVIAAFSQPYSENAKVVVMSVHTFVCCHNRSTPGGSGSTVAITCECVRDNETECAHECIDIYEVVVITRRLH